MIAHGWADDPTKGWIGWLVQELQSQGIEALAPAFPDPRRPDVTEWLKFLVQTVGKPDPELVLVGHSLGCPLILRFLSDQPAGTKVAGLVLVAGMADNPHQHLSPLYDPPLDFAKINLMSECRICIYSDDDTSVDPDRTKSLAKKLDAKLVLDPGKGHFSGPKGCDRLPSVLEAVRDCFGLAARE